MCESESYVMGRCTVTHTPWHSRKRESSERANEWISLTCHTYELHATIVSALAYRAGGLHTLTHRQSYKSFVPNIDY